MKKIELSPSGYALVSDEDSPRLSEYRWYLHKAGTKFYARGYRGKRGNGLVYMHRIVLSAGADKEVDHIDGDGLNNQRSNLRFVDRTQNNHNRKGVKGFHFCRQTGKYRAEIHHRGRKHSLGRHDTADDARSAYLAAKSRFNDLPHLELDD